jgi:DNA-binding CsgD family transcriptional regulator
MLSYEFDASMGDGYVSIGSVAGVGEIDSFLELTGPVHAEPVGEDYALVIARGTHAGTTVESIERADTRPAHSSLIIRRIRSLGFRDIWAVCSVNPDARGIAFAIPSEKEKPLTSPVAQEGWTRIGVHIAASYRLRQRLANEGSRDVAGVFTPDGNTRHLEDTAVSEREALSRFVRALDKARARDARGEEEELLSLWHGLINGRWSVFDQIDSDGKHYVLIYENDPEAAGPRRLTPREIQVATYAAQGHTDKIISYELGISRTTVATHLRSALSKLGLRRRSELIWVYGQLRVRDNSTNLL